MIMPLTRRKFIVASVSALATFSALSPFRIDFASAHFQPKAPRYQNSRSTKFVYTACHQCDQQCAVIARVEDGVLLKLDGNPVDQKSKGRLCAKGQAGILEVYNPYRIKKPMIRTNLKKGFEQDPEWKAVSWDEALDLMSARLNSIIDQYGARAIAGDDVGYVGRFFRAIGSPNTFRCGNTCYYSPISTQIAVMGTPFYNADLIGGVTKHVLMFSNTGETVENPFGLQIGEARSGGAKIVVFDPRLSDTAALANEWIPIRPGTDLAAMLAMINVIVTENLYDSSFVEQYTYGFEQLKEFVKQYTPEWAEKTTDVPAETLRRLARELAANRPSVVTIRRGPSKHRKEYWRVYHAWAILNALNGSVDVRGTTIADRAPELGSVTAPKNPPSAYGESIDGRENLLPTPGGVWDYFIREAGTQDSFADGVLNGPYPVKALIFAAANPMHSSPHREKWAKALASTFVVSIDYQMTDTAWFADIVLPCPTYLERDDVIDGSVYAPQPQVYCRQKVVAPLFDTKEENEIWQELGRRMGIEDCLPPIGEDAYNARLKPQNITFEQLKSKGVIILDKPFEPIRKFNTPTGKIELYSTRFADAGFDPLPAWKGPHVEPSNEYPLYFVSFNDGTKYMSMHAWNPWLEELMDPYLWININTAKKAEIADGDEVCVESNWGKLTVKAKTTEGIRPDTVAMAHGRGYMNPETAPCARFGTSDNFITRPVTRGDHFEWYRSKEEPFGIARFLDFTVKVYKAE
jgi:thiosulfate reductase/polysulfide reductase chain A